MIFSRCFLSGLRLLPKSVFESRTLLFFLPVCFAAGHSGFQLLAADDWFCDRYRYDI